MATNALHSQATEGAILWCHGWCLYPRFGRGLAGAVRAGNRSARGRRPSATSTTCRSPGSLVSLSLVPTHAPQQSGPGLCMQTLGSKHQVIGPPGPARDPPHATGFPARNNTVRSQPSLSSDRARPLHGTRTPMQHEATRATLNAALLPSCRDARSPLSSEALVRHEGAKHGEAAPGGGVDEVGLRRHVEPRVRLERPRARPRGRHRVAAGLSDQQRRGARLRRQRIEVEPDVAALRE
eukprot:1350965-Prymnesium_polylepis.1